MSADDGTPAARFERAALAWAEADRRSDSKRANKIHDRELVPALTASVAAGEVEIGRVSDLMDHPDPGVALWAATFALRYFPGRAERVMRRLSEDPSLSIGFSAEVTLKEWKAGRLEVAWD